MRQLAAALRFVALTSGRAALVRALPLYLAFGIIAVVLFAGNGLDASTVTEQAERSVVFRLASFGAWWLSALPVARAWLTDRAVLALRYWPVPRALVLGVLGAGTLLLQLPWAVLWLRGAGPASAAWAIVTSLALSASWVAGVRSLVDALLFALVVASIGFGPYPEATALCAALFVRGLVVGWRRAPEPPSSGAHWVIGRPPLLAYTSALGVAALRGHAGVFARALAITLAAAPLPGLYIQRNGGEPVRWGLTFWAPACLCAATALAGPVLRLQRRFVVLARVSPAGGVARFGPALLLGAGGAGAGAAFGMVLGSMIGLAWGKELRLWAALGAGGVFWSLWSLGSVQLSTRGGAEHTGRLLVLASLSCVAFEVLLWVALA